MAKMAKIPTNSIFWPKCLRICAKISIFAQNYRVGESPEKYL